MIAVLAALASELDPVRRRGPAQGVLWVQTGVGRRPVERALGRLLDRGPRPEVLISIGSCGALSERLRPGAPLLVEEVVAETQAEPLVTDPTLLARAERALSGSALRRGRLLTAGGVATTPDEKRALARRFGALAVDMESFWVARLARAHELPFLAFRVVLDGAGETLPFGPSPLSAWGLLAAVARPGVAVRWSARTRRVGRELGRLAPVVVRSLVALKRESGGVAQ